MLAYGRRFSKAAGKSCNGFIEAYLAYCNHMQSVPGRQVSKYIEDIEELNSTVFSLCDIPGCDTDSPMSFDLIPLGCALGRNTYFT